MRRHPFVAWIVCSISIALLLSAAWQTALARILEESYRPEATAGAAEPVAPRFVLGYAVCDSCWEARVTGNSIFLPNVTSVFECTDAKGKVVFRHTGNTDKTGSFIVELPSRVADSPTLLSTCMSRVIKGPSNKICSLPSMQSSPFLSLQSMPDGRQVYGVGPFFFRPRKRFAFCNPPALRKRSTRTRQRPGFGLSEDAYQPTNRRIVKHQLQSTPSSPSTTSPTAPSSPPPSSPPSMLQTSNAGNGLQVNLSLQISTTCASCNTTPASPSTPSSSTNGDPDDDDDDDDPGPPTLPFFPMFPMPTFPMPLIPNIPPIPQIPPIPAIPPIPPFPFPAHPPLLPCLPTTASPGEDSTPTSAPESSVTSSRQTKLFSEMPKDQAACSSSRQKIRFSTSLSCTQFLSTSQVGHPDFCRLQSILQEHTTQLKQQLNSSQSLETR